ncbi:adenylate cyclase [Variovorax sp. TBS-050B]|uniref:adenylate/guanylate cyclase domain-containing protein n=1 Tax=Variovorax sp. TBS-050B TaxID=2940551 RepID=UPI0024746CF2|nr:adenylate/guanylate cyclase domain-containing protein [Variovorax sp. TBS-050B]MDH6594690.1 adenylate cyclase [Variovorax sp. TBS-050B]
MSRVQGPSAADLSVRPQKRIRRFRVDVGTIICAVALVQSLLLVALGYWGAERLVSRVGEAAHKLGHGRIEDNLLAFLAKSKAVVHAVGDSPSLHPLGEDGERSAEMLWTMLEEASELDCIGVASPDGHLLMAERYPQPVIRQVERNGALSTETWQFKPSPDAEGGDARQRYATQRIEAFRTGADATDQRWFRDVLKAAAPTWTPPFQAAAGQEISVGYAQPARRVDDEGRIQPLVVVARVSLGHLSTLLRQFGRPGHGESALLSDDHHVLARSDHPEVVRALQWAEGGVLGAIHDYMKAHGISENVADESFVVVHDGTRYRVEASHVDPTGWELISWEPQDPLIADLDRLVHWGLLLTLAFLVLALLISLRLSRLVTAPIENLANTARRIGRLELDELPQEHSRVLEIQHLNRALDDSARSLRAFAKFVPIDLIRQLVAEGHDLAPGGSPRRVTAMFTDVEGFAGISESLEAGVLVRQLTEYFNLAGRVFARHGGVVDKYMGDGIMVLWGAPVDLPDAEYRACLASLDLHAEMTALNRRWEAEGLQAFRTRVGIHTGVVIAGVLGSSDRLSYTAVGDVINVASRIEGANKHLGTSTLMSEATHAGLRGRLATRRIEEQVALRGRQTRMVLYELLEPQPGDAAAS